MIDTITVYFKTVLENQSNKAFPLYVVQSKNGEHNINAFSEEDVMDYSSH